MRTYYDIHCHIFNKDVIIRKLVNVIQSPENNQLTFSIKEKLVTFKNSFFNKLSDYEKSKILYGSDFFLAQFFGPSMEQYFADFKEVFGNDFNTIASDDPKRFLND